MPKFRKRPVEVEADQWYRNADHPDDRVGEWLTDIDDAPYQRLEGAVVRFYRTPKLDGRDPCKHCGVIMHRHGWIDTLEGGHIVCPGDWVITGVAGERYPCKDSIFRETYEPVSPDADSPSAGDRR